MSSQPKVVQPVASTEMSVMNSSVNKENKGQGKEGQHKHAPTRLRGGGGGKDCLLGLLGCFLCCECMEGCCECFADIICCPCEMCC